MSDSDLFALIFSGVWGVVGLVFVCVGYGLLRSFNRKEERLRGRAEGIVTDVVRRESGGTNRTVNWYPIIDFMVDGRAISLESNSGGGRKRHYVGQNVEVLYDPDDPTCFRLSGDEINRTLGRIFLGVGLGCIALGAVVGFFVRSCTPQITVKRTGRI